MSFDTSCGYELEPAPAKPSPTPSTTPASRLNLENIDDDVLYLILAKIPPFGLRGTSMVSHRLRYACLPVMFRVCWLGFIRGGEIFPPPTIRPYIRVVNLRWASTYVPRFCVEFDSLLPHLHALHTISFKRCDEPLPWNSLKVLFSMPALQNLEMDFLQWPPESPFDIEDLSSMQLSLRKFDYDGCHSFWSRPDTDDLVLREIRWISNHPLTLYGFCPGPEVSLLSLLAVMPSMTSLTLKLAQKINQPPLLLWPRGSRRDVNISNLRDLVVSYPHPDDEIFSHLPSELRGISIRDSPRYYITNVYITTSNRTPLLSGTDLLRILNTRTFATLERLEIVYRADSNDPQMIECVVGMFPQLQFLEIHRYPSHDNERPPMNEIVTTLSRLKTLRVLRLNLHSPHHPPWKVRTENSDVLEKRAQIVADAFRLSQLREIAFIQSNHHENYWATWYIDRDARGCMINLFYEDKSSHSLEFIDEIGPLNLRGE
ncbi:hypothetical protein A0H81_12717 [Grifola frondosa]|uniref:F-box domain-containing protein n=1 Tax=Grifola frondosa TaxID=5627 RepID=A0A1C7LTX5_GRIFR|nr:hypothetical protein A0H81_12717 [Grifola frondosa]